MSAFDLFVTYGVGFVIPVVMAVGAVLAPSLWVAWKTRP